MRRDEINEVLVTAAFVLAGLIGISAFALYFYSNYGGF